MTDLLWYTAVIVHWAVALRCLSHARDDGADSTVQYAATLGLSLLCTTLPAVLLAIMFVGRGAPNGIILIPLTVIAGGLHLFGELAEVSLIHDRWLRTVLLVGFATCVLGTFACREYYPSV